MSDADVCDALEPVTQDEIEQARKQGALEERQRCNNIECFELQKVRDSWVRGNYNYANEFIDWIDKRIKELEGCEKQ